MSVKIKNNTKNLVIAALFTAFIAAMSQISIPLPVGVPITLQTFAIALCGYVLGFSWSLASVLTYVVMGAVGVPVFSNFSGGLGILFGKTGGFIFGFIILAILCGLAKKLDNIVFKLLLGLLGLLICHIAGAAQFAIVFGTNLWASILMVSLPYLIKDIISVVAAYFIGIQVTKIISKI